MSRPEQSTADKRNGNGGPETMKMAETSPVTVESLT